MHLNTQYYYILPFFSDKSISHMQYEQTPYPTIALKSMQFEHNETIESKNSQTSSDLNPSL